MSDHQETLTDGQEVTSTDCSEETEKHSSLPVAPTEDSEEVVDTSQKDQVVPSPSDEAAVDLSAGQEEIHEEPDSKCVGLSLKKLESLDEQLGRSKWVVPVRPGDELEVLLKESIKLAKEGKDNECENCRKFYKDSLSLSFNRILTDDAVNTWKPDIQTDIFNNSKLLVELCVVKLQDDCLPLLDLLALVFNPSSKWNHFNSSVEPSEDLDLSTCYARPVDTARHKGRLVDLINLFGELGGFRFLHERMVAKGDITVSLLAALLRPLGNGCADFFTDQVLSKYIVPIVNKAIEFLDGLSDDSLKREAATDAKSESFSSIMKSLRHLCRHIPVTIDIETFRLKMILRLLQIASFSGKMNALNEINKVLPTVSYHHFRPLPESDQLNSERVGEWIKENNVLAIVFRDNLHQPQYVEKLDRLVRFCIKEKVLTLEDLDRIWACQDGKHEAIVKNIHDLLVKLAWDFLPKQLDHLFGCFQRSWVYAGKKQRDELLDFIRHLAEDDKEGIMASKVLELLWNLAHHEQCPTDTMEHALNAHIKILDYSCSQDRETQKLQWLQRCVEEVTQGKWVIPALKQMKEICMLYLEPPMNYSVHHRTTHFYYRNEIIGHLDSNYHLLSSICSNLLQYIQCVKTMLAEDSTLDAETLSVDGRFSHSQQMQIRLDFVRFALKDGQLWLGHNQALVVWQSLASEPAFPSDRDMCFRWFSKLATWDEPDIEPETAKRLFTENILMLPPSSLTDNGFRCFDRFFRMVNLGQNLLSKWNRTCFVTESVDLVGLDYLWEAVLSAPDSVGHKPIELMKDIYTNLSTKLPQEQIHSDFIGTCFQRMKVIYQSLCQYKPGEIEGETEDLQTAYSNEVNKLVRCLKLMIEYVMECDEEYMEERAIPPHGKAHWGKPFSLTARFLSPHSHQPEDFELWTHTHESVAALRRHISKRLGLPSHSKLELSVGNELLRKTDNHRYVINASVPLRDKMLVSARLQQQYSNINETTMQSSDNSTDSSDGSVPGYMDGPNLESEKNLPSVLIAGQDTSIDFLLQLCDFAVMRRLLHLRDTCRNLLKLLPTGMKLLGELLDCCRDCAQLEADDAYSNMRKFVVSTSSTKTVYILELIHSMIMPAVDMRDTESNEFQINFILCGGLKLLFSLLTDANFLSEKDSCLMRAALLPVMKVLKLLLVAQGYAFIITVSQEIKQSSSPIYGDRHKVACLVQDAVTTILPVAEQRMKSCATVLAKNLTQKLSSPIPDQELVHTIQLLIWSSAVGDLSLRADPSTLHEQFVKLTSQSYGLEAEYVQLTKEALEVMSLSMAVCPEILNDFNSSSMWKTFVIDIVLLARNRLIRVSAQEQLFHSVTRCCTKMSEVVLDTIQLLFNCLESSVNEHPSTSSEFFRMLARLINHAHLHELTVDGVKRLLDNELKWLLKIREQSLSPQSVTVEGPVLDGHLSLTVELLSFLSADERLVLGSEKKGIELIQKLVNEFLFPASKIVKALKDDPGLQYEEHLTAGICNTTDSILSAFRLLNALCVGCYNNIECLKNLLFDLFYSDCDPPLGEWEFFPQLGPRPARSFVGLKNAGATCYMNAVIQQLFGISSVRKEILSQEQVADAIVKETEEHVKNESSKTSNNDEQEADCGRKDTNRKVLMQLQSIFGHLLEGKVQFHVPKGFWRDFRLEGQKVNLREQHDAFEFFNTLVDSVDEGLKTYGAKPVLCDVFGGSFADQKICKSCPHRYSREESFTAINADIRLHHNLFESLDSYVKGDLLEGGNAYHCEKCNKKVDTVKRMCIQKLPQVLVIQLKRFDYDWEREMAVKFNDYFEFPREFDIYPYTAAGLAKIEGETIPDTSKDDTEEVDEKENSDSEVNEKDDISIGTQYKLRGVLVHSGQASGGHYYSFMHLKASDCSSTKWYKFDDGDVTEAKMDDEEELRSQCFGGEYTGEVYDHVMKKNQPRRQKKWWSAYLLFYDRVLKEDSATEIICQVPSPILKMVHRRNLEFLHTRSHFSYPYFQFMKQLLIVNYNHTKTRLDQNNTPEAMENFEKLGMLCVQLVTKFLFHSGFHTKKMLRGSANEWFESLYPFLSYSMKIRGWFCQEVFLSHRERFSEYLLECPSTELRSMFAKLISVLCYLTNRDDPFELQTAGSTAHYLFSDICLSSLLHLLKKEVPEHSRHLQQYFQVFLTYVHRGAFERQQLIRLGVPAQFISVALDEGPGPPLRSPYADLSKLYSVVGILVRCCDVSAVQNSGTEGKAVLPNPFADQDVCVKMSNDLSHWLYERTTVQHSTTFVKKIIEENNPVDDTVRFLGFCSWENWDFSLIVITDLLVEVGTVQAFDMRPYLDLLHHLLTMEDSWQANRIRVCFVGAVERADGLLMLIRHGQTHVVHQKRAYLCIKFIVTLCSRCSLAHEILDEDPAVKQTWQFALQWLQTELERRQYASSTYPYANLSPPVQSNEVSNGYFLERSNSAKITMTRAREMFPIQEETSLINEHTLNQQDSGGSSPKSQKEQNEPQDSAPHNNMLESDDRDSINQIESTVVSSSHQDLD